MPEIAIRLPELFSIDEKSRVHIGCRDCKFVIAVEHDCDETCWFHIMIPEQIIQPLRILPHNYHE